jgi:hypothetical protein
MKLKKFDTIYVNGSSLTAGGGLGDKAIKNEYKKLYNLEWDNEKDVTYPKYIADHFECKLVHDAFSGAGAPRLIRRTYEYIKEVGLKKARKTLFLFEITSPVHRVDFYVEEVGEYVITNVRYDNNNNTGGLSSIQMHETTNKYGVKYDYEFFEGRITNDVKDYLSKYHNPVVYTNKHVGELVGLFSFLEKSGIEFFYWFDDESIKNPFDDFYSDLDPRKSLKFENYNCVNQYCNFNGMSIKDELKDFTDDRHPGYFGSKSFAEKTIKMIENRLKPKLWVFGDSHTETFKSHLNAKSNWAIPYFDFIGSMPDNFSEIIAKKYDIELINLGKGGSSNYTIFDRFIDEYKNIKPNDIVIFGWTSINRFKLANNVNGFIDVLPFTPHPKQNDDVELNSTQELAVNKETHTIWWTEVEQFIKITKGLLPKNKILHWTWVDPDIMVGNRIWSQESIDLKHVMITHNWDDADDKVKEMINNCSDYVVNLKETNNDFNELIKLNQNGKKIFFINLEHGTQDTIDFINKNFNIKHYNSKNYKKECYKNFIPYKKYELIVDETNGAIPDKHTSGNGHKELANDLIKEIEKPI